MKHSEGLGFPLSIAVISASIGSKPCAGSAYHTLRNRIREALLNMGSIA